MLHRVLDDAFAELLSCFRDHDDLRRSRSAPLHRLARARVDLEEARSRVHRLRLALHPYGNDVALIGSSVLCERLDEVVHIPHLGITRADGVEWFSCICGDWVERPVDLSRREARRATA